MEENSKAGMGEGSKVIAEFDPMKKPVKRNKFAFACAILASMTSVLLGYAGKTSDRIGRRYTIVFAGAILMGFATNYAFLMVGRFVAGIGVGYALMIAPVYTAEVSPASLLAMPESPRWLVMQGRLKEAKKVLDRTSDSPEEAQLRLSEIKEAVGISAECNEDIVTIDKSSKNNKSGKGVWKELFIHATPAVRRVVIASIGIHFFQQASGIDAVVLYSPRIFAKAGISRDIDKLRATVAVGVFKRKYDGAGVCTVLQEHWCPNDMQ
ncbi:hypothetical protein SOVF_021090 [Spinacia oleracea]|nr:hypothetical protein SOVF_021090 [Spinacia oleracea]